MGGGGGLHFMKWLQFSFYPPKENTGIVVSPLEMSNLIIFPTIHFYFIWWCPLVCKDWPQQAAQVFTLFFNNCWRNNKTSQKLPIFPTTKTSDGQESTLVQNVLRPWQTLLTPVQRSQYWAFLVNCFPFFGVKILDTNVTRFQKQKE